LATTEGILPGSSENVLAVLQEYGLDARLLLACNPLHSCSGAYVSVGGGKSQPFSVGVGLWQGCVLSPLFYIL